MIERCGPDWVNKWMNGSNAKPALVDMITGQVKAEYAGTAKGSECLKETAGCKGSEASCDFATSTSTRICCFS